MKNLLRIGVVAAAGAFALAFAGGALAALNPKFIVISPPRTNQGSVSINASVSQTDDPVAKITMYAPQGYQLNAPNPGQKVGNVKATALAADLGNAVLPLNGQIMSVSPTDATVMQTGTTCDNTTHAATWMMQLTASGQQLNIPMFIDKTTGNESSLAVYKIVVCLPPPDLPQGTAGRAQFGAKLIAASFDMNAFTTPPATGEYRWRSVWTPYTPNTGQANATGAVESQSIVRLPTTVSLNVKKQRVKFRGKWRTLVTLSGKLSEAGNSIPAELVSLQAGPTKHRLSRLKTVMTTKNGTFVKKLYITKPQYFMAEVVLPNRVEGAAKCTASFGPSVNCVSAFIGGVHVLSSVVHTTP